MNKISFLIALLVSLVVGQSLNYQKAADTCVIETFKADSTKYSKVYPLSQYENLRVDVYADDTSSAGFASDSIKFFWWIEVGHLTMNSTGAWDTAWSRIAPLYIDTFDILTAANMVVTPSRVLSDGTYDYPLKYIDTISISGFAYQSRNVSPEWDVWFKIGFKGLPGNSVSHFIRLQANVIRRVYQRVGP